MPGLYVHTYGIDVKSADDPFLRAILDITWIGDRYGTRNSLSIPSPYVPCEAPTNISNTDGTLT